MVDEYWRLATTDLTVVVRVLGSTVVSGPETVKRFIGAPFSDLVVWLQRPGFRATKLDGWEAAKAKA